MAKRGVNKVIIIGNLGADPEVRYTQSNIAIANLSVATSEVWKDKQTGEPKELTEWHRCVAYRRLAEIVGEYLKKGSKVYIEGRLQTRKWTDQNNIERYTTEIVINDLQMLDGNPNTQGNHQQTQGQSGMQGQNQHSSSAQQGQRQHASQNQQNYMSGQSQYAQQQNQAHEPEPFLDDDPFRDDIPF